MSRLACIVLAFASLAACKQVGREIVGQRPTRLSGERDCAAPRRCGELEVEPPRDVPDSAGPVDISACAFEPSCPVGSPSCNPSKPSSAELPLAWAGDQLASLTCSRAQLTPAQGDDAALQVAGSALRLVNLRVSTEEAASVELRRASLVHVSFALHGPVTLRLIDSLKLQDVRVRADGGAQLVIEGGHGDRLALAAEGGSAVVRRASFEHVRAQLPEFELESAELRSAEIAAERFEATDTTLDHVNVKADRILLSAGTVNMSEFGECSAFSAIAGSFQATYVASCREPHRIYGAAFDTSRIDGALRLDRASLLRTELAVNGVGAVEAWDSTLKDVSFCADQSFAFGGRSTLTCGHCDLTEFEVQTETCLGQLADFTTDRSDSCTGFDEASVCATGQPQRMRPPL